MIGLTAGWARAIDGANLEDSIGKDEVDVAFLVLPVTMDGIKLNPFFAYTWIGKDSGYNANLKEMLDDSTTGERETEKEEFETDNGVSDATADTSLELSDNGNAWWLGISGQVDALDPIVIMFDLNYGKATLNDINYTYSFTGEGTLSVGGGEVPITYSETTEVPIDDVSMAGWYFDLAVDYKMDFMTPELFFVWSSGLKDDDDNKLEFMPYISTEAYGPTSFGFAGSSFTQADGLLPAPYANGIGVMASGLKLKDMSFVENLTHDFTFMYAKGTSDDDIDGDEAILFADKDNFMEVDLNTKYQMYENLAAIVELGYAKIDFNESSNEDAAWKMAVGFKYDF